MDDELDPGGHEHERRGRVDLHRRGRGGGGLSTGGRDRGAETLALAGAGDDLQLAADRQQRRSVQDLGELANQRVLDLGLLKRSQYAEHVSGHRRCRSCRLCAGCSQRLSVAQRLLEPLRRLECQRVRDLVVVGVVGAREAEGQLEPAGGDQRPQALERRRDAATLIARDLLLRDAGAGGEFALREPGAAAGLDEKACAEHAP